MGVKNLWTLLEPVGRRINVEALTGKRLAVDASIWLVQFLKAMRDDKGEVMKNAHLLGFFRRICRLLFHRIRPIFVFDGATPALKRRTVLARRRRREQNIAKLKKTAEKLLVNQLKQHALSSLIDAKQKTDDHLDNTTASHGSDYHVEANDALPCIAPQSTFEKLATCRSPKNNNWAELHSGGFMPIGSDFANDAMDSERRPSHELCEPGPSKPASSDSETSSSEGAFDLPDDPTALDPEVLFTLPPSIQYEVILKMREKQFGENRVKFASLSGQPEGFSEHQLSTYLKASKFRRNLEETRQNIAHPAGQHGLRTGKVVSESNREYILQTGPGSFDELPVKSMHEQQTLSSMLQVKKPSIPEPSTTLKEDEASPGMLDITFDVSESSQEEDVQWEDDDEDVGNGDNVDQTASVNEQPTKQKFWSLSHGFKMGRSLAKWGSEEGAEAENRDVDDEDSQIQEAMLRSLEDAGALALTDHQSQRDTNMVEDGSDLSHVLKQRAQDEGPSTTRVQNEDYALELAGGEKRATKNISPTTHNQKQTIDKASHPQLNLGFIPEFPNKELNSVECTGKSINAGELVIGVEPTLLIEGTESPGQHRKYHAAADSVENLGVHRTAGIINGSKEVMVDNCAVGRGIAPESMIETALCLDSNVIPDPVIQGNCVRIIPPNKSLSQVSVVNLVGENKHQVDSAVDLMEAVETPSISANTFVDQKRDNSASNQSSGGIPITEKLSPVHPTDLEMDITDLSGINDEKETDKTHIALAALATNHMEDTTEVNIEQDNHQQECKDEGNAHDEIDLVDTLEFLDAEGKNLESEAKRFNKNADAPTSQMYAECQELLQLFGLPYIIAPMEAEAQCAFLNEAGLVDGVITDDNDVFLFGAKSVYKHLFENKKYVEEYNMQDIETELGLNRDKLIQMALLLGSDYTEGIAGIGIVNATEVVQAFTGSDGLTTFKDWLKSPDAALVSAVLASDKERNPDEVEKRELDDSPVLCHFKSKHSAVRKNWAVPESFPSPVVIEAYKQPKIDPSTEKITFGRPDLEMLRSLCRERFGWDTSKVDELMIPVLKAYDRRQNQLRIDSFVAFRERFAKIKSTRLRTAVRGITGSENPDLALEASANPGDIPKGRKKRKAGDATETAERKTASKQSSRKGRTGRAQKKSRLETGGDEVMGPNEANPLEPPPRRFLPTRKARHGSTYQEQGDTGIDDPD